MRRLWWSNAVQWSVNVCGGVRWGGVALSVVFFVLVKSLLLKAFKNDRNPLKHMFVI